MGELMKHENASSRTLFPCCDHMRFAVDHVDEPVGVVGDGCLPNLLPECLVSLCVC